MIGKNLLWVAKNHGHSVTTMLTDYAAWIEGAQDADIEAIKRRWNREPTRPQSHSLIAPPTLPEIPRICQ